MKKYLFFLIFFCIGCSRHVSLNCSYSDINSIYGVKVINDTLVFKSDRLISFKRDIDFNFYSDMVGNIRSVYKGMKKEGRAFKKFIGGKYSVSKSSSGVNLVLTVSDFNNKLSYFGINEDDGYSDMLETYESMGFSCE